MEPEGFRLLDRWRIDAEVRDGEFPEFFRIAKENGMQTDGRIADALFRLRLALGRVFRWDDGAEASPRVLDEGANQAVMEIVNATIAARLRFARSDDNRIQLEIYVKSRGWYSRLYLALIKPFRYAFVYPAWLGRLERLWRERSRPPG